MSDTIRYNDTFRVLRTRYGDNANNLEDNFEEKYPHIVSKYFSNTDNVPDHIKYGLQYRL